MIALTLAVALAADPAPAATVTAAPGRGLTVTSADGRFAINLRARVQLRQALDGIGGDVTIATQLATARLWVGGHLLSPDVRYLVQLAVAQRDFRDGATSPVFDAYFDLTPNPNLSFRVGQIFVPFDRLRTIRELALQFPDRPRGITELTLDRDLGVYAYSDHLGGEDSPVAYRVGLFGGSGIHQLGSHPPGGLATARLELRPLGPIDDDQEGDLTFHERPGLAIGLAAAYNAGSTRARSTTSTVFPGGTADYGHLCADAVFKWRGVALETEVVAREAADDTIAVGNPDGTDGTAYTRSGWSSISQASAMVSKRVEIATRYARLEASPGTDPAYIADAASHRNEVGGGVNVYWNGHAFKLQSSVVGFLADDARLSEINARVILDATF